MLRAARRSADGALLAIGLLTIVPVRARSGAGELGHAAPWFPAVGALVGAGAAGIGLAAADPLGSAVAGVLATSWLVVVTGALHVDGLADSADALGVRGGRERRLAVMRESTIGTFGALALVLYALLISMTIAALPEHGALRALVLAGVLSRWAAVIHAIALRPARPDGLGAAFRVSTASAVIATAGGMVAALALAGGAGVAALAASGAVVGATAICASRGLGGRTGDTLGATVALTEVVVLLVLLGAAPP